MSVYFLMYETGEALMAESIVRTPRSRTAAGRRLGRAERREQLLAAATSAFVRAGGFAATGLDDVAAEAGVTRMILYRHFASKADLYRAALDRAATQVHTAATADDGELDQGSVPRLVHWAATDPDGFRLLFHQVAHEPDFRPESDQVRASMVAALRPYLDEMMADPNWTRWAACLANSVVIDAIIAWLDTDQPDPDQAASRILQAVEGVYQAALSRSSDQ